MSETKQWRTWWIAGKSDGGFDAFEEPCADYSGYLGAKQVIELEAVRELVAALKSVEGKLEAEFGGFRLDVNFPEIALALANLPEGE